MNTPANLFYTRSDEWLRRESDGTWTLGITDYAQCELGEIVYVELPEVGARVTGGAAFGVVESVKAVGELHCPLEGEVVAVNDAALEENSLVNESPFEKGWLIRVRAAAEPDNLLDAAAYAEYRS